MLTAPSRGHLQFNTKTKLDATILVTKNMHDNCMDFSSRTWHVYVHVCIGLKAC